MSTDVIDGVERSPSPSATHLVFREHIRAMMDTSEILELALERADGYQSSSHRQRNSLSLLEDVRFLNRDVRSVIGQLRSFQEEYNRRDPIPTLSQSQSLCPPPSCAFLQKGQKFSGSQRVSHWTPGKGEHWSVNVTLQGCDLNKGTVCGTMTAQNVPESSAPVVTFFHGEIIDNVNSSFYTAHADWSAVAEIDLLHWTRFPSFLRLRSDIIKYGGRSPKLAESDTIFMRWKESFFIAGGECRLTIAGFYYVALQRMTGDIHAFYYDPSSSPDQRLSLKASSGGELGHSFAAHELA